MRKISWTAALVALTLAATAHAGGPNLDAYTCMKAKDLKTPGPIVVSPNPLAINAYGLSATACTVIKLNQVCQPSNVNSDTAINIARSMCCFKVKCDTKLTGSVGIDNDDGGSAMYTGDVSLIKPAQVCMPCVWSGL